MKAYKGRLEATTISVDNFRPSASVTHYFLTHGHSDHCTGLTPTWNYSVIYTTSITKRFIISKYHMEPSLFVELSIGVRRIIHFVSQPQMDDNLSFAVTPIDANHCPGAVCYLFEGYFGRFLCTGDFRYRDGLFGCHNVFEVDRLYLDDTYCRPYYNRFLTASECAAEMHRIISLPRNAQCRVMIAVDTLGKEGVLIELSKLLESFIVVNQERYKRLQLLWEDDHSVHIDHYFTTNPQLGHVFMVHKREISLSNLDRLNKKMVDDEAFIGILPSGWSIHKNALRTSELGSRVYTVPYSAHSSFEELCDAVRHVQPKSIIPIVADRFSQAPRCFKHYQAKEKPIAFAIPPLIKDILNGNRNIATIAVQHLRVATNTNGNHIVTRKIAKRKCISSLVSNRKRRKRNHFEYKAKKTQKQPQIIDLLSSDEENDFDSVAVSQAMANDSNFVGFDMLTQTVDLVVAVADDDISLIVISDEEEEDSACVIETNRKRKHRQMITDSQECWDDEEENVSEHKSEASETKVVSAKNNRKERAKKRRRLSLNSCHILDITATLQMSEEQRTLDQMYDSESNAKWQNGIDFVATLSGTDGELSDFEDETLLNTLCDELYYSQQNQHAHLDTATNTIPVIDLT
eukprot:114652_1